ncbi:hypothetical protein Tco_0520931 [Tanacetum coccineum]
MEPVKTTFLKCPLKERDADPVLDALNDTQMHFWSDTDSLGDKSIKFNVKENTGIAMSSAEPRYSGVYLSCAPSNVVEDKSQLQYYASNDNKIPFVVPLYKTGTTNLLTIVTKALPENGSKILSEGLVCKMIALQLIRGSDK